MSQWKKPTLSFVLFFVLLSLSLLVFGCGKSSGKAGSYSASAKGLGGNVTVTLRLTDSGTIEGVQIDAASETPEIGGAAAKKLGKKILDTQSLDIDGISGASITSEAVKAAAAAALAKAGLTPQDLKRKEQGPAAEEKINADVVVIGAGTSGTGASLAAAQNGAKVVVLEKTDHVGGLGIVGMGLLATESPLQKEKGLTVTTEDIFRHLIEYNHYRTNGPLMKAVLDKSGSTITWLMENGIGLKLGLGIDQKAHVDYPKTYHMWTNSKEDFPNLYKRMAEEYGLDLRLNTRGYKLIVNDGVVSGIIAETEDGGKLTVHAKSVILCTGGFGGDPDRLKAASEINAYNYFGLGNKGEGVDMAWSAGADKLGEHVIQIHLGDLANSTAIYSNHMDSAVFQVKDVPLMWVNKEGVRFVDESVVYDNVIWGNAAFSAGGEYYTIVDQASVDSFIKNGIPFTGAYQMNGSGLSHKDGGNDVNVTIAPLPTLQKDLKAFEGDVVFSADTLKELATKTGMNPDKLTASVARYNKAITSGHDDNFYKDPAYLKFSVEKGPFYAIKVRGSVYGSIGGVRINEETQAVREDGTPVEGLFVAGADAGGMYDNTYPDLEGLTMSFAMNTGRIAGENAAKQSSLF
ncbi:FAD-dependent oxidoreductase [Sediminispirochaeta bajacaliforniensis]|uniref:FAD-dependent oxidoreductase n=1 Tax=Sediminispirochaeta bajacaliforniensis TaxID=148 RepID=UPI000369885D|nr:FAD-dependent oxidoreductase [Sediminispirochaeta bajacaliforniensis]